MNVETIPVGPFEVNCYLVWTAGQDAAIVIDPGADAASIENALRLHNLSVGAYLLTHGHADHLGALGDLVDRHPAPAGMHPADSAWAFSPANQIPPFYSAPRSPDRMEWNFFDGQVVEAAGFSLTILETPGHTPGGVCLYFPKEATLFSGDTLFQGSVGRTDYPGGNSQTLSASLRRLARLPDSTAVFPGHGPSTTLRIEKQTNFFLRGMG